MDIILASTATIISVIIGGLIAYYVSQREIKRNKKLEVYLEFLYIAHRRYFLEDNSELTEQYMNVIRKIYLIGSINVLKSIEVSGYIPKKDKEGIHWSEKDPEHIENPLKLIIIAMRKDIGEYNRKLNKFNYVNWFFK